MSTENIAPHIEINTTVLEALVKATKIGLQMTGVNPEAVGCSKFPSSKHGISVLVGLMGDWTGTLTMNMSEEVAFLLTEGLLGEKPDGFTEEILDAVGEVGNMISRSFKDALEPTEISLNGISCPAIVMGPSYEFYYASGFLTVSVEFEVDEISVTKMASRYFTVSVSLMKR